MFILLLFLRSNFQGYPASVVEYCLERLSDGTFDVVLSSLSSSFHLYLAHTLFALFDHTYECDSWLSSCQSLLTRTLYGYRPRVVFVILTCYAIERLECPVEFWTTNTGSQFLPGSAARKFALNTSICIKSTDMRKLADKR